MAPATGASSRGSRRARGKGENADAAFLEYVREIAHARFIIRKTFRIVDDRAKRAGIDPLEHQMLLQIAGHAHQPLSVGGLAERLDIVPALASRLITTLESRDLATRVPSGADRRITHVKVTDEGLALLVAIDAEVRAEVTHFQRQLKVEDRAAALSTFGFYVGLPVQIPAGPDA
jgi:DNA-binding MarR family transcriptional regulator